MNYVFCRPQYVCLQNSVSNTILSNTGAPQGTILALFLFTTYTADFQYNTCSCFLHKPFNDTVVVGLIKEDEEEEYRRPIKDFVIWSGHNNLHLNITKTKEMVVVFMRKRTQTILITIRDTEEMISRHLGVQLDNKQD